MQVRFAQMTRRFFGRRSEPHHPDQQQLDELMREILVDDALRSGEAHMTAGLFTATHDHAAQLFFSGSRNVT